MTSNIIYHDFVSANIILEKSTASATPFAKAKRVIKANRCLNRVLNAICTLLCGVCVGISITVLVNLLTVG